MAHEIVYIYIIYIRYQILFLQRNVPLNFYIAVFLQILYEWQSSIYTSIQ